MNIPKPESLLATGENVGVDVGVNVFAALSTGELIEGPNAFKNAKDELAAAQQRVARRQRGSSRQRKARAQVARLHERISNQRRDHAHKTARALIQLFDILVFESLQITNMTKSAAGTVENPGTNVAAKSGLNRAISDQGWSYFMKVTTDKAEEAGRLLMKVDPAYSSRDCSQCAHRCKDDVCFRGRLYVCSVCGLKLNRDVNAARVILDRGLQALAEVEGLAEVEFVEPSKAVKRDDGSQQRKAVKQTSG
jgi:putative transposase